MPWSLGTPSLPYVDITCHILKPPSHMASIALVFPHLSPGSEIYLHLLVPELHRYLWKRHWAQLLGIGLGWEELEDHRESHLPPKGRGDRGQWRETVALAVGWGGGVGVESSWKSKAWGEVWRRGFQRKEWMWHAAGGQRQMELGVFPGKPIQWPWITLGRVQVHLHSGVAPGVQDFPGKDFLHGHGCRVRGVNEYGQLIP